MTRPATVTQSDLDRAVKAAAKAGMAVTVTAPDGKVFTFTPLDARAESDQPVTEFDAWKAKKREAGREGRS
jgi:hypothetical protein